jgi:hypothetical protein
VQLGDAEHPGDGDPQHPRGHDDRDTSRAAAYPLLQLWTAAENISEIAAQTVATQGYREGTVGVALRDGERG